MPQRRGEDVLPGERYKIVLIDNLLGELIDTDLLGDPTPVHEKGDQRLLHHIQTLSQITDLLIAVIPSLGEQIYCEPVVPVILEEVEGLIGKIFKIPIVVLDAGFVYDHTAILDHPLTNVSSWIQLIRTGDRDIAPDLTTTTQIVPDKPGSECCLTGARHTEVHTYDVGDLAFTLRQPNGLYLVFQFFNVNFHTLAP